VPLIASPAFHVVFGSSNPSVYAPWRSSARRDSAVLSDAVGAAQIPAHPETTMQTSSAAIRDKVASSWAAGFPADAWTVAKVPALAR